MTEFILRALLGAIWTVAILCVIQYIRGFFGLSKTRTTDLDRRVLALLQRLDDHFAYKNSGQGGHFDVLTDGEPEMWGEVKEIIALLEDGS